MIKYGMIKEAARRVRLLLCDPVCMKRRTVYRHKERFLPYYRRQ